MDASTHSVKLTTIEADLLQSVGYEDLTHTLYLKFTDGSTLRYQKVPRFRFQGLLAAPRKDAYFKTFIKDQFLASPVQLGMSA